MTDYLCSYGPLMSTAAGRTAVRQAGLPPFIDGSCRREPDLQARFPSISALCRAAKFAPRLQVGDRVAYITRAMRFGQATGWALVALLRVVKRFESHADAADWYRDGGAKLPSNCLVPGNPPQPFHFTIQKPPPEAVAGIDMTSEPERVLRRWDASYAKRAREHGVFLACEAEFLELRRPPILRRADMVRVFGRVPGTQNPPSEQRC